MPNSALSLPVGLSMQHGQDLFRLEDVVRLANFTGSFNCLEVVCFIQEIVLFDLRNKAELSTSLVLLDIEVIPWSPNLLERENRPSC